ncbi:MAG: PEP-CTERM sorting domain-containing protein [Pirellulales bacterium]
MIFRLLPIVITFISVLVIESAYSAPLTIDFGVVESRSDTTITLPREARFRVKQRMSPSSEPFIVAWTIPNIGVSDVGLTWTLTEQNAIDFGADWSLLSSAMKFGVVPGWDPPHSYFVATSIVGLPGGGGMPYPSFGSRYSMSDLDHMEFTLHELFVSPIGSVVRWQFQAVGDGVILPVPEPTTLVLFAMAASFVSRRRHSKPSQSGSSISRRHGPTISHL